jgi:hypothetical protein
MPAISCGLNGFDDHVSMKKTPAVQRERAQCFPRGYNQVRLEHIGRLKEKPLTRMRQHLQRDIQVFVIQRAVHNQHYRALFPGGGNPVKKSGEVDAPSSFARQVRASPVHASKAPNDQTLPRRPWSASTSGHRSSQCAAG